MKTALILCFIGFYWLSRFCAGGSYGPILWTPCVPAEQLEHLGWAAGVCVACGHPGLRCVSRWKSNLRNPPCSPVASNTATTEVRSRETVLRSF